MEGNWKGIEFSYKQERCCETYYLWQFESSTENTIFVLFWGSFIPERGFGELFSDAYSPKFDLYMLGDSCKLEPAEEEDYESRTGLNCAGLKRALETIGITSMPRGYVKRYRNTLRYELNEFV